MSRNSHHEDEAHEDELLRLARALRRELERCHEQRPPRAPELTLETLAELVVLLTALRPLEGDLGRPPLEPSRIAPYIEDMIDPEFGLRPARTIITQAAEQILRGYGALELPRRGARRGRSLDGDDE